MKLMINTPLVPVNPDRFGNAITVGVTKNGCYQVLTDFGNLITLTEDELSKLFTVPNWYDEYTYMYTLEDRLRTQIELLQSALTSIEDGAIGNHYDLIPGS